VLKECIARAGGLEAGLRYYVGAANLDEDGGYANKVLSEQQALRLVASGKNVPLRAAAPAGTTTQAPSPSTAPRNEPAGAPAAKADDASTPEQLALLR